LEVKSGEVCLDGCFVLDEFGQYLGSVDFEPFGVDLFDYIYIVLTGNECLGLTFNSKAKTPHECLVNISISVLILNAGMCLITVVPTFGHLFV
jgi:hypothetical protein